MRTSVHIVSHHPTDGDYLLKIQATLEAYKLVLTNACRSITDCRFITESVCDQLLHYSELLKNIQDGEDELIHDLATALYLVTLTAFGSKHYCAEQGLGLIKEITRLLQKNLTQNHRQELDKQEGVTMNKRVLAWLGNSNYYRASYSD